MYLSIIIPCYNEEKRLPETLLKLHEYLSRQKYSYEILAINDGSGDTTKEVISRMMQKVPRLAVIHLPKNRGKGAAVREGMLHARGEYRLFLDADYSVSLEHLDDFFPHTLNGFDIVIGSIEMSGASIMEHAGPWRRATGKIAKYITRALLSLDIQDTQRGFKLFSRSAAEMLFPRQTVEGFGFDMEILFLAREHGLSVKELPVEWKNSAGSSVNFLSYLEALRDILKIRFGRAKPKKDDKHT